MNCLIQLAVVSVTMWLRLQNVITEIDEGERRHVHCHYLFSHLSISTRTVHNLDLRCKPVCWTDTEVRQVVAGFTNMPRAKCLQKQPVRAKTSSVSDNYEHVQREHHTPCQCPIILPDFSI